jgi:hypothetical protein
VGTKGFDMSVALNAQTPGEMTAPTIDAPPSNDAWRAFTHLSDQCRLGVQPLTGEVAVRPPVLLLPDGFIEIAKMSEQEHRNMGAEFTATLDEELRPAFYAVLADENYWSKWKGVIAKHKQFGVHGKWMSWRQAAISKLLVERLEQAQVKPDVIPGVVTAVLASKAPPTAPTKATNREQTAALSPGRATRELRDAAHAIIDQMTHEELERLWLPLGSIVKSQGPVRR